MRSIDLFDVFCFMMGLLMFLGAIGMFFAAVFQEAC